MVSHPIRWLIAGAVLLAAGGLLVHRWQRTPSTISQAPPPPTAEPVLFADWLAFEPEPVRDHPLAQRRYIDAALGHQVFQLPPSGLPRSQARELMLEDDKLLLSSGRCLWNHELLHQPGLVGKFCYLHSSFCARRLLDVQFFVDGQPVALYDDQYTIERYPSHTLVRYRTPPVVIEEHKFITFDDRAVLSYAAHSADNHEHALDIEATAPYLAMPAAQGSVGYPLLGRGTFQRLPVFVYLDAPGFTAAATAAPHVRRTLSLPADGSKQRAQLAVSYERSERAPSTPPSLPEGLLERHRGEYNDWFLENVPYFDSSDEGFKRMWYYRWWVVRFNLTQADTPDLRGYRFYEGKLGFDNPITFAVPVQMKELSYLRDPTFGRDQLRNAARNQAPFGALLDPPGSPYWNETYSHWIAAAAAEYHRVHPIPQETLRELLPPLAADVRAWLTTYDADGDGLPQRAAPRVTGYDLDILSFWYFFGLKLDLHADLPDLERVDFASFVYANARGIVELANAAGLDPLAREFAPVADRLQAAVLQQLWDDDAGFFFPQRAADNARIPVRELHGLFPFAMGLTPNDPRYHRALAKLVDPAEFWARFPPVITSQAHYRGWTWEMDGLTRNIAPHPISMGARTALEAYKRYPGGPVTAEHFMALMERYNALVYPGVNPFDPYWRPNAHEYYSKWEPHQGSSRPKPSDISHDFHSMYNALVVEGAVGLTPRVDDVIELNPAAKNWDHFALHRLRYKGHDLTIVWDRPDGNVRYRGYPEGFSVYVDGRHAATRSKLDHFELPLPR